MIAAQHSASTRKGIWRPLEKLTAGSLVQTISIWLAEQTICCRRRRRCLLLRHASSLNPATGWPVSPSISFSPLPLSRLDLMIQKELYQCGVGKKTRWCMCKMYIGWCGGHFINVTRRSGSTFWIQWSIIWFPCLHHKYSFHYIYYSIYLTLGPLISYTDLSHWCHVIVNSYFLRETHHVFLLALVLCQISTSPMEKRNSSNLLSSDVGRWHINPQAVRPIYQPLKFGRH